MKGGGLRARYYNMVGVLAWKAAPEWAEALNAEWKAATSNLERVVAVLLIPNPPEGSFDRVKAEVIAACQDGKLTTFGHTADNEESRPVPPTGWLGVAIDEVNSSIGKAKPTWLGIHFDADTVRSLWPANPLTAVGHPKKRTGPTRKYLKEIAGILAQHEKETDKAIENGTEIPQALTSKQVTEKLKQSRRCHVSERTVRENIESLRRQR